MSNISQNMEFDRPKLKRLIKARDEAEKAGEKQFTFEGHEVDVGYAKYLIEYLDQRLPKEGGKA